jgi:hypothetical protein
MGWDLIGFLFLENLFEFKETLKYHLKNRFIYDLGGK